MNSEEQRPAKKSKPSARDGKMQELMASLSLGRKLSASSIPKSSSNRLCEILEEVTDRLLEIYNEKEVNMLTEEAGKFLRNLDDSTHDEDIVKSVIEVFPQALKYQEYEDDYFPIQHLLHDCRCGYSFVPLLASEGRRLNLFSDNEKGGIVASSHSRDDWEDIISEFLARDGQWLLRSRPGITSQKIGRMLSSSTRNDVDFQALLAENNVKHDEKTTAVLQKLFEMNIFEKKDIIRFEMICGASYYQETSKRRFEYLVGTCPEVLRTPYSQDLDLPIQFATKGGVDGFDMVLKAGLQYYPRKLGFLLEKGRETDRRTIEMATQREGINISHGDLFKLIHEVIPPSSEHPILHDVIRLAPKYFSLFWSYYPDAIHLRDKRGRLPLHIALQKSAKWSPPMLALINTNDPIDRHENDPVTGLYPFMSAASGACTCRGGGDLNLIYFLLRRNPSVWEGFRRSHRYDML